MTRAARRRPSSASSPKQPLPASNLTANLQTGRSRHLAVRANKTIAAPAAAAFAAWADTRRRARWLAGVKITVRTAVAPGTLRLICEDDATEIEVRIAAQGRTHCAVAVHHTNLANDQMVVERRHCWKEMLGALKHYLEGAA